MRFLQCRLDPNYQKSCSGHSTGASLRFYTFCMLHYHRRLVVKSWATGCLVLTSPELNPNTQNFAQKQLKQELPHFACTRNAINTKDSGCAEKQGACNKDVVIPHSPTSRIAGVTRGPLQAPLPTTRRRDFHCSCTLIPFHPCQSPTFCFLCFLGFVCGLDPL